VKVESQSRTWERSSCNVNGLGCRHIPESAKSIPLVLCQTPRLPPRSKPARLQTQSRTCVSTPAPGHVPAGSPWGLARQGFRGRLHTRAASSWLSWLSSSQLWSSWQARRRTAPWSRMGPLLRCVSSSTRCQRRGLKDRRPCCTTVMWSSRGWRLLRRSPREYRYRGGLFGSDQRVKAARRDLSGDDRTGVRARRSRTTRQGMGVRD
jgi:hypothetical protein